MEIALQPVNSSSDSGGPAGDGGDAGEADADATDDGRGAGEADGNAADDAESSSVPASKSSVAAMAGSRIGGRPERIRFPGFPVNPPEGMVFPATKPLELLFPSAFLLPARRQRQFPPTSRTRSPHRDFPAFSAVRASES